jgi:hypothetical protein
MRLKTTQNTAHGRLNHTVPVPHDAATVLPTDHAPQLAAHRPTSSDVSQHVQQTCNTRLECRAVERERGNGCWTPPVSPSAATSPGAAKHAPFELTAFTALAAGVLETRNRLEEPFAERERPRRTLRPNNYVDNVSTTVYNTLNKVPRTKNSPETVERRRSLRPLILSTSSPLVTPREGEGTSAASFTKPDPGYSKVRTRRGCRGGRNHIRSRIHMSLVQTIIQLRQSMPEATIIVIPPAEAYHISDQVACHAAV